MKKKKTKKTAEKNDTKNVKTNERMNKKRNFCKICDVFFNFWRQFKKKDKKGR